MPLVHLQTCRACLRDAPDCVPTHPGWLCCECIERIVRICHDERSCKANERTMKEQVEYVGRLLVGR